MECLKCNTSNPETNKFCSQCGAPLVPSSSAIDEYVCRQVESTLKTLAKERSFVELEVVETISNKLMDRAKRFAYFVGIPIGLLSLVFIIFGIKSIYDMSFAVKIIETAKKMEPDITRLSKEFDGLNTRMSRFENDQIVYESDIEKELKTKLDGFIKYFEKLGHKPKKSISYLKVKVDRINKENTRYDQKENRIYLGESIQNDSDLIFREYAMQVMIASLAEGVDRESLDWHVRSIESGLEDYFTCSYTENPKLGVPSAEFCQGRYGKQFRRENYLRDLENNHKFVDIPNANIYQIGGIWGAAFWEMRKLSGKENSDKLLFATWNEFIKGYSQDYISADCPINFVKIILKKR